MPHGAASTRTPSGSRRIVHESLDRRYRRAERFLLSREFFGMKLGLENISSFLDAIGAPQKSYPTIHVAGTNGKGSVCAMLESALRSAGYRTGLYTSPHLITLRERIQVNRRLIPQSAVVRLVEEYRREILARNLTFFEVLTALAFVHFKRSNVDIAVIEVGLGGRLDATNTMAPLVTACTDISLDHVDILGDTLSKIAVEKGGIVKPGVPHVIGMLPREATAVMRKICRDRRAPIAIATLPPKKSSARSRIPDRGARLGPALSGPHQLRNCATVSSILEVLKKRGISVPRAALQEGIATTSWRGRFEQVRLHPQKMVIADVAHNPGSMEAFVATMQERYPGIRLPVILGFVKGKDHSRQIKSLSTVASEFRIVRLRTHRTAVPTELLGLVKACDSKGAVYDSLAMALRGIEPAGRNLPSAAVVGSHYLVGELLKRVEK